MRRIMLLAFMLLLVMGVIVTQTGRADDSHNPALVWQLILPEMPVRIWHSPVDHKLYVTTDRDLRLSSDKGVSWQILYPQLPLTETMGISAMAFAPGTAVTPTLFLARNIPGGPAVVYRTVDGGVNWTAVFTTTSPIYDLAAVNDNNQQLLVFTLGGAHVWRSTNGGDTWATAETGLPEGADLYRIHPSPTLATDATLYLTGFGRLLRSTNGGDSWHTVTIPDVDIVRHIVFSPHYATDHTLWATYFFVEGSGISDPNGVARSLDGGQTWQLMNQGLPVDYLDGWIMGLAASPDYPTDSSLYAIERTLTYSGTAWTLFRSPLANNQWLAQGTAPEATPNGLLAVEPDLFFLPTQAGLWRLDNNCWQWLVNGDAETNQGWQMPATAATATYSTQQAHAGQRSIRIGLVNSTNQLAYSSARQQVTVPDTAVTTTLHFWLYPISTGAETAVSATIITRPAAGDAQYLLLLDENQNVLETLLWQRENSQTWQEFTFDLSDYARETIWLHFGVYNDGLGGITGMYLDDVSLLACEPSSQPAPIYLPLILNNVASTSPLLIEGVQARQVIGHPQSETLYAVTTHGLYRSDDNAATWTQTGSVPPVTQTIRMAAGEPAVLYAGEGYPCLAGGEDRPLWKSVDSGQTWNQLPTGLNLEPLAIHPSDSDRVYARGCVGPYLTTDGGINWQLQGDDLFGIYEVRFAAPVFADNWQTVYLGGVTEGGGGGIIGSQGGGTTWELISSPMNPDLWAISAMTADPLPADSIYFADPHAVWGSEDGGTTWYTSTAGLEEVIYDPGGPISQTYGLLSLSVLPDDWLVGTMKGLYQTADPTTVPWQKITGPAWQDTRIIDLLRRWNQPQQIFVTTANGVYLYQKP